MVAGAAAAMGGLDILVNNAASPGSVHGPKPLAELTDDIVMADINVKVMGYLRCTREAAPYMQAAGWGRVINISGLAARGSGNTVGSIRNVSVAAITKNLADELGPDGINVTVVHPGLTRTEATAERISQIAASQSISEAEAEARMASGNSVRRIIDSEDIAAIVAFLASPKSIAITGDTIAAGGGVGRGILLLGLSLRGLPFRVALQRELIKRCQIGPSFPRSVERQRNLPRDQLSNDFALADDVIDDRHRQIRSAGKVSASHPPSVKLFSKKFPGMRRKCWQQLGLELIHGNPRHPRC